MTTLRPPALGPPSPEATLPDGSAPNHSACGEDASTACTKALGVIGDVEAPDAARGDQVGAAVVALGNGLYANWYRPSTTGAAASLAASLLATGHYVLVGVGCNPNAIPQSPTTTKIRHWIAVYSNDGGWSYFQCWDDSYQRLSNLAAVVALDVAYCIVAIGRTGVNPITKPPPVTESDMRQHHWLASIGTQPNVEKRAYVDMAGNLQFIYGPPNAAVRATILVGVDPGIGVDGHDDANGVHHLTALSTQGATAGRMIEMIQAGDGINWVPQPGYYVLP